MKFSLLVSIFFLLIIQGSALYGQGWQQIGTRYFSTGTGYHEDIDLWADNGVPYIVYTDIDNNQNIKVEKFDGNNWVAVGQASLPVGTVRYPRITIDSGTIYISFQDYDYNEGVSVMTFDGQSWSYLGQRGFCNGICRFTSIAVYNGEPYVVFEDNSYSFEATVMKYNGSNWVYVGNPGFSAGYSKGQAYLSYITFDDSIPYVSFLNAGPFIPPVLINNEIGVMKYDGNNWVGVGNSTFSVGVVPFGPIDIYNGEPYLAYNDSLSDYKAVVRKFDGANWVPVGPVEFSAGTASFPQIVLHNGVPYVCYIDLGNSSKATVMYYNGASWIPLGGSAGFTQGAIANPIMRLDGGTIFITYIDSLSSTGPLSAMSYDIATSLETIEKASNSFTIGPNPVSNLLNISTTNNIQNLAVLGMNGQVIKRFSASKQINVSDLPQGVYVLEVKTEIGWGYKQFVKH